jgi:DNA-binding IclR family transcriptional regulator
VSSALAVADDLDMVYIAYRAGHRVATLRLGVGSVLPMGMSAIGRAFLWGLPRAEQCALIGRMKREGGPQADALEAGIRRSFVELDEAGTCCVWGGYLRDTFGIALPVRVGRQRVLLGMSCGRASVRPDLAAEQRRIAPALKQAALELQDLLADSDGRP